jgi:hypothetical protein
MTSKHALIGWQTTDFQSHDERSDENLINAIATGSEAAMRTLYARHHVRIYHFIVRLGCDTDRAEDLVSEVFLTVWLARSLANDRGVAAATARSLNFPPLNAITPFNLDARDRKRDSYGGPLFDRGPILRYGRQRSRGDEYCG